jgi:hypothetical protein
MRCFPTSRLTAALLMVVALSVAGCEHKHHTAFAEADDLFDKQRYEECLRVLEAVRSKDPNTKYRGSLSPFPEGSSMDEVIDAVRQQSRRTKDHDISGE